MSNSKAEISRRGRKTKSDNPWAKGVFLKAAKRKWVEMPGSGYFAKSRLLFFVNLFWDWSWEMVLFEKLLLNSPGVLDSISFSFEGPLRLELSA